MISALQPKCVCSKKESSSSSPAVWHLCTTMLSWTQVLLQQLAFLTFWIILRKCTKHTQTLLPTRLLLFLKFWVKRPVHRKNIRHLPQNCIGYIMKNKRRNTDPDWGFIDAAFKCHPLRCLYMWVVYHIQQDSWNKCLHHMGQHGSRIKKESKDTYITFIYLLITFSNLQFHIDLYIFAYRQPTVKWMFGLTVNAQISSQVDAEETNRNDWTAVLVVGLKRTLSPICSALYIIDVVHTPKIYW